MRIRTEVAGILREFRLTNIRNKFEAEELASSQNYEVFILQMEVLGVLD
jgi:breast cancer metastasis-suppressor 1-like protein